jgi:hypothetical protein
MLFVNNYFEPLLEKFTGLFFVVGFLNRTKIKLGISRKSE